MIRRLLILPAVALAFVAGPAAAAMNPQEVANRTEDQLGRVLRFTPTHRVVYQGGEWQMATCGGTVRPFPCDGLAYADRIAVSSDIAVGLALVGESPANDWYDAVAYETLVHEELHRPDVPTADMLMEGVVEANAWDLTASTSHVVLGVTIHAPNAVYPAEVHEVRKASAMAARATSWRAKSARLWRQRWLTVDDATRHAEISAALGAS